MVRALAVLTILSAFSADAWADDGEKSPQLWVDIDMAWEEAGATVGRMGIPDEFNIYGNSVLVFTTKGKGLIRSVPAFRLSPQKLWNLPVPQQLFGLNMQCSPVRDGHLKEVARLKTLTALKLMATRITDAGLKELAGLQYLTMLDLGRTKVTDTGLKQLTGLKNLTVLSLAHTEVTDAGLKELAKLKNLTALDLRYTKVTTAGLRELAGLKKLTTIHLTPDKATELALKK